MLAVSSKYAAISEGRVVTLDDVSSPPEAEALAERYHMNPVMAQLVLQEADHIFGGIEIGFLLTVQGRRYCRPMPGWTVRTSPAGYVVLLPEPSLRDGGKHPAGGAAATGRLSLA